MKKLIGRGSTLAKGEVNVLPRGITGFDCDRPRKPWASLRKPIVAAVYSAGARVIEEVECDGLVTPNYHFVRTSHLSVLVHDAFRFVAFSTALTRPYLQIPFDDWPEFAKVVDTFDVLQEDFLNQIPSEPRLSQLGDDELSQLSYWKPNTLGDVIFNDWD